MKKTNNQKTSNKKDKTNESLINALKNDERVWVDTHKKELNNTQLLNLLEKTDEKIISLFLDNDDIKRAFFVKIKDSYVFKMQDFRFYMNSKSINNSYTKYANRIGLTEGKRFLKDNSDVVLDFPFKDCVLQGGQSSDEGLEISYELKDDQFKQTKTKRKEIFFNQTLAYDEIDRLLDKKVLVNFKKFYKDDENKVVESKLDSFKDKDNLLIKGNNLIALHCLKEHLKGDKAKLIYIDPPYNTGNDSFNYNDKFNHSTWLVFMKNRLEIARELLRDDGVIFVQCDDNEQAYLKVLMDEIFGRENFVNCICVKMSEVSGVKMSHTNKKMPKIKEYLLVFKKYDISLKPQKIEKTSNMKAFQEYAKFYTNIIENKNDDVDKWKITNIKDYIQKNNLNLISDDDILNFKLQNADRVIYRTNNKTFDKYNFETEIAEIISSTGIKYIWWQGKQMLFLKDYINELIGDLWTDISTINLNKEGTINFTNAKKPEQLIYRIIDMTTQENDLVIDFFAGSGTTLAVAHKMKRRYIGIEQMDYIENITKERLKKVIDGEQGGISKACEWNGGGVLFT